MAIRSRSMGSTTTQQLIATAALLLALSATPAATGRPNTTIISVLCNQGEYTRGDPFAISLAYVLDDLVGNTPSSKGRDYYDISPFPNAFAYGHAECSTGPNLTAADCSDCLHSAVAQLNASCSMRIGGRVVLSDCSIRYEQYPFAG